MSINQILSAQSESAFTASDTWTPSKHLSELKVSDTLVLTISAMQKAFDLKFSTANKLEELRNFRECISNPTIDGSPRKNILQDNYRWVEIFNWNFNQDMLTLNWQSKTIVLKLLSNKKEEILVNKNRSSRINEMVFKVINTLPK